MKKFYFLGTMLLLLMLMLGGCHLVIAPETGSSNTQSATEKTNDGEIVGNMPNPTDYVGTSEGWEHEASLYRFLSDVNHNGELLYTGEDPTPPGSLVPVDAIPVAEQSLVGQTVPLILAQDQPYVYICYYYDAAIGVDRLATVISAEKFDLLMIFQTDLKGAAGLSRVIAAEEVFEGTILSMTNITKSDTVRIFTNMYSESNQDVSINVFSDSVTQTEGGYLGTIGCATVEGETTYCNVLFGAPENEMPDSVCRDFDYGWFYILERFGLLDVIRGNEI